MIIIVTRYLMVKKKIIITLKFMIVSYILHFKSITCGLLMPTTTFFPN